MLQRNCLKTENAITLVALIITIIILVILAAVSIKAVYDSRIVGIAINGTKDYAGEAVKENAMLDETADKLESIVANLKDEEKGWHYDDNGNVTNGTITLEIGDTIDYDATKGVTDTSKLTYTSPVGTQLFYGNYVTANADIEQGNGESDETFTASSYTGTWKILGVDESTGEILIMSSKDILADSGGSFLLYGLTGARYGIIELNNISKIYGYGYGASGAKSITSEDVNKITGYNPLNTGVYDPDQTESGIPYAKGELDEYGNKVTFYWDGTEYPYFTSTNGKYGNLSNSHSSLGFNWLDSSLMGHYSPMSTSATTNIIELENTYYEYYYNSLSESSGTGGLTDDKAISMLFGNDDRYYWIATACSRTVVQPNGEICSNFLVSCVYYGRYFAHNLFDTLR